MHGTAYWNYYNKLYTFFTTNSVSVFISICCNNSETCLSDRKVNLCEHEDKTLFNGILQTPCKNTVHQAAPTSLLTTCSLSGQACFLRVTPPCWAVPIVCRVPPSPTHTSTNCCVLTTGQQTYHMPQTTSGFSTSLFLFPYNGIQKEKLWVNLLHFQIIWLRFCVRLFQPGRLWPQIKWELWDCRHFQTRSHNCDRRLLSSLCLPVLSISPSVCPHG